MKKITAIVAAVACLALSACLLAGCGSSDSKDEAKYKIVDSLQDEHYAVAFKLGDDELAAIVTQTLADLDKDGKIQELVESEKYASQGMAYKDWCLQAPEKTVDVAASKYAKDFTLIVGFDAEYPPYGYIDENGEYTGFDLDLAKMVADKLGWGFKADPIDWDSKDALLSSGTINCIWNGFTAEGRDTQYALSGNYMVNGQVVVVKADSKVEKIEDLAGLVVMTQSGSAGFELLNGDQAELAGTFKELQSVPDYANAFMNLDSGACDAIVCDLSIANVYIAGGSVE